MNKNVAIWVGVFLILLAGGFLAYSTYKSSQTTPEITQDDILGDQEISQSDQSIDIIEETESTESGDEDPAVVAETMVEISDTGFDPKTITIQKGSTVTWTNTDTANHTVSSDDHPTHTQFPFLNVGPLKSNEKKSLVFDTAGTFTYHDHLNPTSTGIVVVE